MCFQKGGFEMPRPYKNFFTGDTIESRSKDQNGLEEYDMLFEDIFYNDLEDVHLPEDDFYEI